MTKKKTWLIILSIHLFVALIALSKREMLKVRLPNKIAVTTVQLKPPPPPKPAPQKKAPPKAKKAPARKKVVKAAQKKPIPKPKKASTPLPKPKKAPTPLPKPPAPKVTAPLPAPPAPIKKLRIDQEKIDQSLKKIVQVMQTHLQLPEFGKVKLKLTLGADGSVKEVHVLDSESTLNRVYLETHLKELPFPPIEQGVLKKDEETFHITFCNAT